MTEEAPLKPYGVLALTTTSPAQTFTEPITLAEMQTYLRLPDYSPGDTAGEALIEAMITAARQLAESERYQNRDLVGKQWDLRLDYFPACDIELREPLASVDLVQYTDEGGVDTALVEGTDYIVDLHRGLIRPVANGSWPSASLWPSSAVLVRFTTATPTIDEPVLNGMKFLVSMWHEGRLPFEAQSIVQHSSAGVIPAHTMPNAVEMLLKFGGKRRLI